MTSSFVRSLGSYTFNDSERRSERSVTIGKGDIIAADAWYVDAEKFEPIELDWRTEETAQALARGRRELADIEDRYGRDLATATPGARERYERMTRRVESLNGEIRDNLETRSKLADAASRPGHTETLSEARPAKIDSTPEGQARSEARRAIEGLNKSGALPGYAAERAEALVTTGKTLDQMLASRWASTVGAPAYRTAFAKIVGDPDRGHLLWTPAEADAYRAAVEVRAAMGVTATHGAEMLPLDLDPAIMLTNAGSINSLREISRVVQTISSHWHGVSSAGATAEWKAESAEAADGSPLVADVDIPTFLGDVDVIYSYEVGMDALNFLDEIRRVVLDAAGLLQATAFTTGNGTTAPAGVITGATTSPVSSGGALAAANVYALQNALPARFQANAQFAMNLAVLNTIAQFETTAGALKFPEIKDNMLVRRPLNELSDMTSDMATAGAKMALYGDFRNFIIADRIGATLEILSGYGANHRPTAQRHAFLTFRTGSKVAVPEAFRVLNKS